MAARERQADGNQLGDHLLACAEHASLAPRRLLFVSAGMANDGGGIAAASRLLLAATRDWAQGRHVRLRVLTLGGESDLPPGVAPASRIPPRD